MDRIRKTWRTTFLAALLGAVTLAAFWPVLRNDFIRYDDRDYVTANPHVLSGLNWGAVKWAFATGHAGNWHPVTWLSHMLDVALFGVRPGWHHFVNLLLHIVNTILLFLLLTRLTGASWRSLFVAGFFALHPLHVESVAWAAERKDLLSGFFFFLTIWMYADYATKADGAGSAAQSPNPEKSAREGLVPDSRRSKLNYALALFFFALGLMSKPMLVTLPLVLLLLDFWPLKRLERPQGRLFSGALPLLREKIPFLALALLSSLVTFVVQGRGHAVTLTLPFALRAGNAVMSYLKYLAKTAWPIDLAIFYPHPATRYPATELWPGWLLVGAALALAGVTVSALVLRRRVPWFMMGWLWYAAMLVPVCGLVQVGQQAMADRYTYLPLIGIFICVVWGVVELSTNSQWGRRSLFAAGILALCVCAALTEHQAKYWRNNLTVFEHALAVNPNNAVARCHVGIELGERHQYEAALEQFNAALRADPNCAEAYYGLGFTLENLNRPSEAMEQYRNALRARPWYALAHLRLGAVLWSLGQRKAALAEYEAAARLNPEDLEARYRFGIALVEAGDLRRAVPHLDYVARLNPDFGDALSRLTEALLQQGKLTEAEGRLRDLAALHPDHPAVHINLGTVLWQHGQAPQAIEQYQAALRLDPADPVTHYNLGTALSMQGQIAAAGAEFAEAVRLKPDYLAARVSLGEMLAGQNRLDEALKEFRETVRLSPTNANLRLNLASALIMAGQTNEAKASFAEALRLQSDLPEKLAQSAQTLAAQGRAQAAVARLTTALQLRPDWTPAMNDLAWLLATDHRAEVRNGAEAVRLAERACQLDGGKDSGLLATLAAAYAEAGRFDDAVATAEKAKSLAVAAGQIETLALLDSGLELYRKQLPFRK